MWPRIIHHEPEWKRTIARDGRGDAICVYELEHGAGICGTSILYVPAGRHQSPHGPAGPQRKRVSLRKGQIRMSGLFFRGQLPQPSIEATLEARTKDGRRVSVTADMLPLFGLQEIPANTGNDAPTPDALPVSTVDGGDVFVVGFGERGLGQTPVAVFNSLAAAHIYVEKEWGVRIPMTGPATEWSGTFENSVDKVTIFKFTLRGLPAGFTDDCPYTFSHTRQWCGYQGCRDK